MLQHGAGAHCFFAGVTVEVESGGVPLVDGQRGVCQPEGLCNRGLYTKVTKWPWLRPALLIHLSHGTRRERDGPRTGEYRLAVKDFGLVAEADIDLRPLAILIGPSNTGKSYLAVLIYAMNQCFRGSDLSRYGGSGACLAGRQAS